jgi:signal transduction histidine kinase
MATTFHTQDAAQMAAELRRLENERDTLLEIARALVSVSGIDDILPASLERLTTVLESADSGTLMLYDQERGDLFCAAAVGLDFEPLKHLRLRPAEGMAGECFISNQSALYQTAEDVNRAIESVRPEGRELFGRAMRGLEQPQSAVCAALVVGDDTLGVLSLYNLRQPGSFDANDLAFVEALANLIALAVNNAELAAKQEHVRALEEANRFKSEVIASLAHDMRTPLASIKGYSTALLMEGARFDAQSQREFLEIIDDECDHLTSIIHEMLESSLIEGGQLKLDLQPVILPRLVSAVVEEYKHRSRQHRILVDFPRRFPIVDADPYRVQQIVRNLLDNAIKYSAEGSLIVIRGVIRADEVEVSVADQGIGISPDDLNRLFEKFFRVNLTSGRYVPGTGLGLPIARAIVEMHGGRIWAESKVGEGTTLYFTLPRSGLSSGLAVEG